ncbi:carbonic anhydrase [Pseudomonadota bacterium]
MNKVLSLIFASFLAFNVQAQSGHDSHDSSDSHAVDSVGSSHSFGKSHKEKSSRVSKKSHGSGAHWGYEGKGGPEHWGDMKRSYATCKIGRQQSPIDIRGGVTAFVPPINFNYKDVSLEVLNNGHTIQVQRPGGGYIWVGNNRFELAQFHFHGLSEHIVNGVSYPMEMHLVHKDSHGNLAVVGVFIKEGRHNSELDKAWKIMPKNSGDTKHATVQLNAADMLPDDRNYFHYMGSLTTPPCSENVRWFVLRTPIEASAKQIKKFGDVMPYNARPAQPMYNRFILMSE